ncbi:MAG: hypothetical protein KAH54_08555 [Candidatus Sabulitectum sp.]|nr:hypothetical protein [Candidatus Sabulitectum sp.]
MKKQKDNTDTRRGRSRGAALMIALLAAVVVMLAATLLIGLTRKMVNSHIARLETAQITLSENSATDGLAFLLAEQGPGVAAEQLQFDLAGVSTEFSHLGTATAGIRTGFYSIENAVRAVLIPAGDRLIAAQRLDGSTVLITFFSGESFKATSEFVFETDLQPVTGTPILYNGEQGAVIVFEGNDSALICVVTSQGVQTQVFLDSPVISSTSMLSAGESTDGTPLVIITRGANLGTLYNCESGVPHHISSPAGTCPVFLADGSIFGSFSSGTSSMGIAHVVDVFDGDFNNDGRDDMAFATRYSLSVFSGATSGILSSSPGGSLTCWGSVGGRTGLCGMWRMPNGQEKWFRLGYDGFTEFIPEMNYMLGWQGRFYGNGSTLTGFIDGRAVIVSSSGYILELLSGEMFTGNADGGDTDFFSLSEDGVDACFNPVNGDGLRLSFSAANRYRGSESSGETHLFSIYESQGERRVFHTLEGFDQ